MCNTLHFNLWNHFCIQYPYDTYGNVLSHQWSFTFTCRYMCIYCFPLYYVQVYFTYSIPFYFILNIPSYICLNFYININKHCLILFYLDLPGPWHGPFFCLALWKVVPGEAEHLQPVGALVIPFVLLLTGDVEVPRGLSVVTQSSLLQKDHSAWVPQDSKVTLLTTALVH